MIDNKFIENEMDNIIKLCNEFIKENNIDSYYLKLDLENPKYLYVFFSDKTYYKIEWIYKINHISNEFIYISLLSFINYDNNYFSENGIILSTIFYDSENYSLINKKFSKIIENLEIEYYENLI